MADVIPTITFYTNGEPLNAGVLNRPLQQIQNAVNSYNFGGSYTNGSGITITGTTIAVDGTVLRTSGNFSISGTWTFTTTITAAGFTVASDSRLKDNQTLHKKVQSKDLIKLKQWVWKDDERVPEQLRGKEDSGVIADDVEKVFPKCVHVAENGIKTVDLAKLAIHLILAE